MFNSTNNIIRWFSVVVTAVSGVYILAAPWDLGDSQLIILGFVTAFTAVMLAGSVKQSWSTILGLAMFGFYLMGRGVGFIEHEWFRFIVGPLLIVLSLVHFMQLTTSNKDQ